MSGDWTKWNGGHCPVPPETLVQVKLALIGQENECETDTDVACSYDWDHKEWEWPHVNIIAYRIVKED